MSRVLSSSSSVDLLMGLEAIGKAIGLGARQVQYLHEKGELPTFKLGAKVCARRSTLAEHFAAQERAATAARATELGGR